ncbi:MAG: hypothetical protein EBR40_10970 [Proteobacteria bacterium]|nr:hypothetical protein [Pseudomonadota bacterium]
MNPDSYSGIVQGRLSPSPYWAKTYDSEERVLQEALRRLKYTVDDIATMKMSEWAKVRSQIDKIRAEMRAARSLLTEATLEGNHDDGMSPCMWCGQLAPSTSIDAHEEACSG